MTASPLERAQLEKGVTRRDFMKFCSMMAGTLALPSSYSSQISEALQTAPRTPVIWLEFQDCAGCTESFLRASRPSVAELVLDVLSVDYHETIMAAAGHQAEAAKKASIDAGGYLLLVEGSIPTAENGIHCTIGGRTAVDILEEAAANAAAVVAIGSCATYGGWPKASPNPTGAVAVKDLVTDKPVVNLAGCSVNFVNITATVVHFLTFGELPALDDEGRPLFAYGHLIHDNCERRGHFDAGEFVRAWGDEGHRLGWCLYEMGCKGPTTYANCPAVGWNDTEKWPIAGGHGCIGCTEIDFWELGVYNLSDIQEATPPESFAPAQLPHQHLDPATSALIGGAAGVTLGVAGAAAYTQLSKKDGQSEDGDASSAEED